MRNNYQFKINQKSLSGDEIARHQDFDALLEQLEASKTEKSSGAKVRRFIYWSSAAAAAIALFLVFKGVFSTSKVINENQYFAQQPFVNEPVDEAIPSFAHYSVTPNQGGVFEYESGSRLIVPSAAFMNDRGNLVEGDVNLYYREYTDFVDFFISGVPMTYDSAGISYLLESSGIVEIFAEKEGKRVVLAEGKSIKVEMAGQVFMLSGSKVPDYNVYQLDTAAKQWVYRDIDMIQFVEETLEYNDPLYQYKKILQDEIDEIGIRENDAMIAIENNLPVPKAPLKPRQKDKNRITFELDFLQDKLPEGNEFLYGGTIWQLSPNNPEIDQRAFQVVWEDATIKSLEDNDYELELIATENRLKLIVNPVLTGKDYELALEQYAQELLVYENQVKAREKALQKDKVALHKRFEEQRMLAREAYRKHLADSGINLEEKEGIIARKVVNNFQADDLGIWICARPVFPERVKVKARFVDQNGNELEPCVAFIADKNRNVLTKFLAQPGASVSFDNNSENIMWMVLPDGKIAVFKPEQFKAIDKNKERFTFEMEIVEKDRLREFEVREILHF
jgi:hypothetical protein